MPTVCVFCASSAVSAEYLATATAVGRALGQRGWGLVYGGSELGMMGAVSRGCFEAGGHVLAVVPAIFDQPGFESPCAQEVRLVHDMAERKARMIAAADAFLILPGGYGTLDELFEVVALKQLRQHTKPIALLNTRGFYDALLAHLDRQFGEGFTKPKYRDLFRVATDVETALDWCAANDPDVA